MLKVANAPCSWGVIENVGGTRDGYVRVIDEMAATGYVGTELGDWGFMPTDPARLTEELAQRNLALLGSWVSVFLHDRSRHEDGIADAVRTAKLLAKVGGPDNLIVLGYDPYGVPVRTQKAGRITEAEAMTPEQWDAIIEGSMKIAKAVKEETGLRTVAHHHIGTFVETPEETAHLLANTDPALLGLCFDTGHWMFGGGDPVTGLKKHADRIWHVHFKDCDQNVAEQSRIHEWDGVKSVGEGVFCELGQGGVDFPAVIDALEDIGYDGWIVVEQDVLPGMGTPKESAQRNREYLKSIGL
ncbi:MAG: TIM barrel protein [Anaerolineae bacterium]|nr:TIM barrel protein [Anaerolineae bacterium]